MKTPARPKAQLLNDLDDELFVPPSAMKKKLNRKIKDSGGSLFKAKSKKPARKGGSQDLD